MPKPIIILVFSIALAWAARGEDWPQWRGRDRDGIWHETGTLQKFRPAGLPVLLTARWLTEWRDGIDGSRLRPGFMKLGVVNGKLTEVHAKLVRAAAKVDLQSGLTIAIHTGDGNAALDEVRILREEGVAPGALIWVHAQNDPGPTQIEVAKLGAGVSLDGYSALEKNRDRYKKFLLELKKEKLLGRVLLSHDDFWSVEGEGGRGSLKMHAGGAASAYEAIFTHLLPDLRQGGFDETEIRQLTVRNPAEAFSIGVRRL